MAKLLMLCSKWLDQDLVGWIQINLLPQSLAWLLGFGTNHSLFFFVQYWHHHIETRQIRTIHWWNFNNCSYFVFALQLLVPPVTIRAHPDSIDSNIWAEKRLRPSKNDCRIRKAFRQVTYFVDLESNFSLCPKWSHNFS